ncbi:uncharacterized protein LOC125223457 isoform X2 [Salvia hispanica]|nr:uncharacterized protein LOC125223457 isoform X2 [Salvia hispanica]
MAVSHCETTACRPIRRLCGRQTLLDLLQRAQCERKAELQGLLEHRPVSNFTHRNRIQALLRGRFLRNETMIPDIRPSSVAARELGLLRQQHTVSGLREGFLSKLEKSASTSTNSAESDSWLSDQKFSKLESTLQERGIATNSAIPDLESDADRHGNRREFGREVTAVGKKAVHDSGNEEDVSSGNEGHVQEVSSYIDVSQRDVPSDVGSVNTTEGKFLEGKATEQMSNAEGAGIVIGRGEMTVTISNEFSLETDTLHSLYESRSGVSYDEESGALTVDMEGNMDEQFDRPVDSVTNNEEWVDTSGESMARIWQETPGNELLRDTSDNNAAEQDQMQESHDDWPNHVLQDAIDSWLAIPSREVGDSVGRLNAFYYSDDNNVHSTELRELFSRRRVSGLLRSGFRESLDQVLQSHVERQVLTSPEWELENESSSPSLVDQDQQQQPNVDRAMEATERNSFDPASSFVSTPQPLWDEEMQGASLPHFSLSQHFGMEWEVVNELRNNMARLQQRLNNMQSMLEQCMDMQIELQRSVQQEVSAALNRSFLTKGTSNKVPLHEESQWDSVRKGICCLCHDSNIDTLLYRCGHMCTCSKCAEKLIQDTGKCPMCRAPVVEAVRAYFIQ